MNFKELINMVIKHDYKFEYEYNDIPDKVVNLVKELKKLDADYEINSNKPTFGKYTQPWNLIINNQWEGYWKKNSGNDALKFVKYLQEAEDDGLNIIDKFHKEWNTKDTPYCISKAEEIRKEYVPKIQRIVN